MSLICIETQEPLSAESPLRLLTRPDHAKFCGVSHDVLNKAIAQSGTVDWTDSILLYEGDLVVHEGQRNHPKDFYTLGGSRIGKPIMVVLTRGCLGSPARSPGEPRARPRPPYGDHRG